MQRSDPVAFDSICAQGFPRQQAEIEPRVARSRRMQSARKCFGKTLLEGTQHRLVHLVAALPDVGTDHRGDRLRFSQSLPQCGQTRADHAARESAPAGVNRGNHAPAIAREQYRQAVGGHHRNAHADLL
jgi:hypothetical protein